MNTLQKWNCIEQVKRLIIGYEESFVRFGYDWFESFCERYGTQILVVNEEELPPRVRTDS